MQVRKQTIGYCTGIVSLNVRTYVPTREKLKQLVGGRLKKMARYQKVTQVTSKILSHALSAKRPLPLRSRTTSTLLCCTPVMVRVVTDVLDDARDEGRDDARDVRGGATLLV